MRLQALGLGNSTFATGAGGPGGHFCAIRCGNHPMALPGTDNWVLALRLRLQLHLSTLHLDRVDHCIAAVLLANLAGLFLDECGERIEVARDFFSRLVLGFGQRLVKRFDLRTFGRRARALHREKLIAPWIGSRSLSALGVSFALEAIHRTMLRFVLFVGAHALHREERILRPAVALFANPHLLAPQVGLNRVPLRHLVVLEALRKTQARAIADLANQRERLPFHGRGRPFARIVEENLVLDLQPAKLLIEQTQFFISGHKDSPLPTLAFPVWGWRGSRRTREGWYKSTQRPAVSYQPSAVSFLTNQPVRRIVHLGVWGKPGQLKAES